MRDIIKLRLLAFVLFALFALDGSAENVKAETTKITKNQGMTVISDITYNEKAGAKGVGDLWLPEHGKNPPAILMVHGGGWRRRDRHRMDGITQFITSLGYAVFNIDYRDLRDGPYPICEDDCMAAAEFLLNGTAPEFKSLNRQKIVIAGASAGGQLALMIALKLPQDRVAGVIDISGPSDMTAREVKGLLHYFKFTEGHDNPEELLKSASPVNFIKDNPPPLLILHSKNDKVVNARQADRLYDAWRKAKGDVQAFIYDGDPKKGHDFWRKGGGKKLMLWPKLETRIASFLKEYFPIGQ